MIAYSQDFCHGEKCNVKIFYLIVFLVFTLVDRLHPQKCDNLIKDHYMNKQKIYINKKSLWGKNALFFNKYKTCYMNKINITMMHVLNHSNYNKNQNSQLDWIYKFEERKQFN